MDAYPFAVPQAQAPPTAHLHARLARAWAARHSAPNHRDVVGALLPDLIRDAQSGVRQAERAVDRRAAQAVLSEVYSLAQFFVAYQPDAPLLWRVAERGLVAAQESEDPRAIGVAAWLAAQAHRDSGPAHFDAADAVNLESLRYLQPLLPDAPDPVLAIAGALTFEAGYTAARRGETGTAWRYWDQARDMAARLPADYFDPVTSFSQSIMGAHAVTVAVELHAGASPYGRLRRPTPRPFRPARAGHGTVSRKRAATTSTGSLTSHWPHSTRRTRRHPRRSSTTATRSGSCWRRRSRRALPAGAVRPRSP